MVATTKRFNTFGRLSRRRGTGEVSAQPLDKAKACPEREGLAHWFIVAAADECATELLPAECKFCGAKKEYERYPCELDTLYVNTTSDRLIGLKSTW